MADLNKYDPRLDSLVVETSTDWTDDCRDLSPEDRKTIAAAIHQQARLAGKVSYERTHTGFIRRITVSAADITRLYDAKVGV